MNVLRSLARQLLNTQVAESSLKAQPNSLAAVREQRVAKVVGLPKFADAFEQLPQGTRGTAQTFKAERAWQPNARLQVVLGARDGFEAGRRAPVDLSGGVRTAARLPEEMPPRPPVRSNGFSASLDDLGRL